MDSQSEKFPWKVCASVIVLTVLAMSAVDVHKKRKAGEAQASAQAAVQVPDYSQAVAASTAHTPGLYAWSNVGDGSSFTCEAVDSAESWLGAAKRRVDGIPGARVELVSDWQAFTFTPRGDGTDLMVKTFFGRGRDFCRNAEAEQKAIAESKAADEKAYLAEHANDRAETRAVPAAGRAPGTLPKEDAGKRWYVGIAGLQAPLSWNCQPMTDDEIRLSLSFMEARGGLIARWHPTFENDDRFFEAEIMDSMVNPYGYQAAEELRRTKIFANHDDCVAIIGSALKIRQMMVDEFKAGR